MKRRGEGGEGFEEQVEAFLWNQAADGEEGGATRTGVWLCDGCTDAVEVCGIGKDQQVLTRNCQFVVEFEGHGFCLADDSVGAAICDRIRFA